MAKREPVDTFEKWVEMRLWEVNHLYGDLRSIGLSDERKDRYLRVAEEQAACAVARFREENVKYVQGLLVEGQGELPAELTPPSIHDEARLTYLGEILVKICYEDGTEKLIRPVARGAHALL